MISFDWPLKNPFNINWRFSFEMTTPNPNPPLGHRALPNEGGGMDRGEVVGTNRVNTLGSQKGPAMLGFPWISKSKDLHQLFVCDQTSTSGGINFKFYFGRHFMVTHTAFQQNDAPTENIMLGTPTGYMPTCQYRIRIPGAHFTVNQGSTCRFFILQGG